MSYYFQDTAPQRGAVGGVKKGGGGWGAARSEGAQCCEADLGGLNGGVRTMRHPTDFPRPPKGGYRGVKKWVAVGALPGVKEPSAAKRIWAD